MIRPEMGELYEGNKLQVECCDTPVQQAANIPMASKRGNPTTASHADAVTEWRLPRKLFRLILEKPVYVGSEQQKHRREAKEDAEWRPTLKPRYLAVTSCGMCG